MPPSAEGFPSRLFLGPALRTQPDRRLVTLVRDGYETAFEEIVRRYGRLLTRYAASIVGGRCEDVTQDAFSRALLALRRDDAEIELRPWLFRIVRNTALNDLRDSPPSPEVLAEAIAGGRNPAEELEQREELTDLMQRLQALPEPQRAAIVMRELEGLSHEEIAAALGLSGGGARQAIYRARQALRDGAGMLIPLPLLQAMLAGSGPGTAEAAVGVASMGSAAGAGVALKATAATVLVAGAVGTGVALKDNPRSGDAKAAATRVIQSGTSNEVASESDKSGSEDRLGNSDDGRRGGGDGELGDDHGGRGENEPGDNHGGRSGPSGDRSPSGDAGANQSDPPNSGKGSGSSGSGSGSGHDGSGASGSSGSGGSGPSDGGSGSGSGSNSSGSSGSSGPGPGDEPSLDDGLESGSSSGPGSGEDSELDDHSGDLD
jgi:RNA polymerase sigma factor (sigma-70 family)